MGLTVGRMPNTWDCLLEEKDRVLYWSGEVLARVADNVNQEESFQIDYGNEYIDRKVDSWIETSWMRINKILSRRWHLSDERRTRLIRGIEQIKDALRMKMREDYRRGYRDIRKHTEKVDNLGSQQRRIHAKIHELETTCAGNVRKFQKKFGPLRLKTFRNLRIGEKMMFEEMRLKTKFFRRMYAIDHENMKLCTKSIDKLMENIGLS
ncbi:PREDICTED: uncharacterized protein LOC107193111 [Dufourea novaeangliae]|uniref:uncharacterized protein LOC107193111 n=1 Tax=Dufourea novaeangliae TaxID=178035 RepID=UPI0007675D4C|nr:PREDICTED: uncharacterized protein LOC107193111 [Dufourea novaeangliae]